MNVLADTVRPPPTGQKAARDQFGLTRRERQVVDCLADGMRTDAIAALLGLRVHTIRQYVKYALAATGTHHRGELVARVMGRAK